MHVNCIFIHSKWNSTVTYFFSTCWIHFGIVKGVRTFKNHVTFCFSSNALLLKFPFPFVNLDICKCPGSSGFETITFYFMKIRPLTELQQWCLFYTNTLSWQSSRPLPPLETHAPSSYNQIAVKGKRSLRTHSISQRMTMT